MEDAPAIAGVHVRSWQAAYRGLLPDGLLARLSVSEREAMWREAAGGRAGPGALFVAEREGRVLGFCALSEPTRDEDEPEGVAELGAIYIDPQAWRSGAGTELMKVALAHLRSAGWREVTLWVLQTNQPALDFYARFGFVSDGARRIYEPSGSTGIRLRRALES